MTPAEQLIALYEQGERELRALIRDAARRGAAGTARYYRQQLGAVGEVLQRLRQGTYALSPRVVRAPYSAGLRLTSEALGVTGEFTGVDERAVDALARALQGHLLDSLVTVGRAADDALREATLQEVAGGAVRGAGRRETTARLRDRLAREGTTGLVDSAGRRWRLEVYSAMAVRTTARQAGTAATVNRLREEGEDLIQISSHPGSCDQCVPWQGRTFSLDGRTPGYPRATVLPPIHPNCRHVATPARASFEAFERELGLAAL